MFALKNNILKFRTLNQNGDSVINQTEPSRNRVVWLEILECMAIFLVLWGHSIQYLRSDSPFDDSIFRFIYSFHMPLFMALSGFFAQKLCRKSFVIVYCGKKLP
ncbi:MAG: acyltransferase family protein [Muribaculaceae bacterium]|nr:acyltransferase family protein [Muribaculaceae bacterium]